MNNIFVCLFVMSRYARAEVTGVKEAQGHVLFELLRCFLNDRSFLGVPVVWAGVGVPNALIASSAAGRGREASWRRIVLHAHNLNDAVTFVVAATAGSQAVDWLRKSRPPALALKVNNISATVAASATAPPPRSRREPCGTP